MNGGLEALCVLGGSFGGVSLIIWTSMQAKIAHIKASAQTRRQDDVTVQDSAVLAEIKALKQQMAEMHSTSHGFDIAFDEALNRLEGRVGRLETKSAAGTSTATSAASADAAATLRNGQSQ